MNVQLSISAMPKRRATAASLAAAVALALVAGCSSVKLDDEVPVESRSTAGTGAGNKAGQGAGTGAVPQSKVETVDLSRGAADNGAGAAGRVVYFDFDSFVVKDEYRPIVERQAKMLSADRKKRLQIEGHTDERGGREYNLALGQKRAEAVAKSMALMGASDSQIEAVSFGKERPAVQGSDESAWAKNRRAELNNR